MATIKLDEHLAELLGIMCGDGYIAAGNSEITVTGHASHDKEYVQNHVSQLFSQLFGIVPKIRIQPEYNTIRCRLYSEPLAKQLNAQFGLPRGRKIEKLAILRA